MEAFESVQVFEDIVKSQADDRSYRLITLPNKLDILLISDPSTDKSAAAMDVHVGHLVDPEEFAGLAHFCEHLLFMGTEKHPEENAYSQYLSDHGGHSNAFTSVENTNYYFDVNADHLEGALDRFAQFFIAPLFLESTTDRELNAVDSEHKKNLQSDSWRLFQLEKDLCSKDHPYHKFGTGNIETLKNEPVSKGLDIRKFLFKFHESYYSANIMKCVILGKEPLDTLMKWAVSMLSAVKNKNIVVPSFAGHPLTNEVLRRQILVKPVKEMKHLEMTFPFPDVTQDYRIHPQEYISHLIGHEGDGSILALIKSRGWALSLSAGVTSGGTNFDFFKISVELTDEGLAHWEEIIVICFQYMALMRNAGIQEWIFRESEALAEMSFRFKEKGSPASYASATAGHMQHFDKSDILSGNYLFHDFRPDVIQTYLNYLQPDHFRVMVVSPSFDSSNFAEAKYYGTEYDVQDFSDALKEALKTKILEANSELHLPEPNDFIPSNFDVRRVLKPETQYVEIIRESDTMRLWHKKDDTFYVPKVFTTWLIKNPFAYMNPKMSVLARLFTDLLKDYLSEFSYYAEVAGLHYDFDILTDGLILTMDGYNHKLCILLAKVIGKMKNFHVDSKRFQVLKERHERLYRNFKMETPTQHALYWTTYMLQEKLWTNEEKLEEISNIKEDEVANFVQEFFNHFYIEAVVHGNVEEKDALKWANIFDEAFQTRPLPLLQRHALLRSQTLPQGSHTILSLPLPNPANPNSAIEYVLQIGGSDDDDVRSRVLLFSQMCQEPCFDVLRTKEQLGYMVFSSVRKMVGNQFIRVVVQSERDPGYLETRIEAFWVHTKNLIENLGEDDFVRQRTALVNLLLEKPKKLVQEYRRLWSQVSNSQYDFPVEFRLANNVGTLSKSDIIQFMDTYIMKSAPKRTKYSTHISSAKVLSAELSKEAQQLLNDVNQTVLYDDLEGMMLLKNKWGLSGGAYPSKDVKEFMRHKTSTEVFEMNGGISGPSKEVNVVSV
ncbi:hypothetical protein SeMB42_g00517 [Synchytrium endobioticum]|uniref:Insulin-degrading enzyme n=1 Tax=Synchytrium endobioticum TaxID=286115 RepID=A0A507DLQ2_9FUNG|nr:hypothetical protein SeLEV6574_g00057 [Synchytrium endobioticum]TPX53994.1 hypothetical protein SeMB42_g00517 [Synchytrium endobioticum]